MHADRRVRLSLFLYGIVPVAAAAVLGAVFVWDRNRRVGLESARQAGVGVLVVVLSAVVMMAPTR